MKYTRVIVTTVQDFWIVPNEPPKLMKDLHIIDSQERDSQDSQHTNQISRLRIDNSWQKISNRDRDESNIVYPIKTEKQYTITGNSHFIDFNNLP